MKISYERHRIYDSKTEKSNRFQIKALSEKSKSQIFHMSHNSYKSRNLMVAKNVLERILISVIIMVINKLSHQ